MSAWWETSPVLTPRQRDVQAAHHAGFWRGFRRGIIWGHVIGLPVYAAFLIWWFA